MLPTRETRALRLLAATVSLSLGDQKAAEEALRSAIEIDPSQFDAYSMLGQLYARQKRLDAARAEFERLAKLRPSSAVAAHTLIGMILEMEGKPKEARARYEKVVDLDSRAAVAANNLAWLYAEGGGNLDIALQLAQTAKTQLPDRPEVDDTLGWVYYRKNLPNLAVPPLQRSVEANPKNPIYHYHLGLAHLKNGNEKAAESALRQALRLDPGFEGSADAHEAASRYSGLTLITLV